MLASIMLLLLAPFIIRADALIPKQNTSLYKYFFCCAESFAGIEQHHR